MIPGFPIAAHARPQLPVTTSAHAVRLQGRRAVLVHARRSWCSSRQAALDLGGLHSALMGTIDMNAQAAQLGIAVGKSYPMDTSSRAAHRREQLPHRDDHRFSCIVNIPPVREGGFPRYAVGSAKIARATRPARRALIEGALAGLPSVSSLFLVARWSLAAARRRRNDEQREERADVMPPTSTMPIELRAAARGP